MSEYYICVFMLLYIRPHAAVCVLVLLYMCPHTTLYADTYCYMRPHATIYVYCFTTAFYYCILLYLHFTTAFYHTGRCLGGGERCLPVACCIKALLRLYYLHFTTAFYYRSVPRRRRALLISGLLLQTKLIALSARLLYSASAHLLQVRRC